jgi:hypothetical protein
MFIFHRSFQSAAAGLLTAAAFVLLTMLQDEKHEMPRDAERASTVLAAEPSSEARDASLR